jgi:hypothetical protein
MLMVVLPSCGIFGFALVALSFIFWIWMIVDCATNPTLRGSDKIVWLLVIIFLHFLGAFIYFLVGKRRSV